MIPQTPWWVVPGLGSMAMGIFAGAVAASCFLGDDTLRTQMFTAASSLGLMAASYYFGSSQGSQKKDDTISRMKNGDADAPPVAIAINNPDPAMTTGSR